MLEEWDDQLARAMECLQSIPQVGKVTAATVLAETAAFDRFRSRSQIVKYAGMDIVARQSGSSVLGRSRLSKRGNSRLRGALHMPAVGMINPQGPFNDQYRRVHNRTGCKMKAVVAVQRKLLVVKCSLIKRQQNYEVEAHQGAETK